MQRPSTGLLFAARLCNLLHAHRLTVGYYPGIDYALSQRNEHHSFLRLPDNLSDADKQRSWTAMKKILGPSFALAPQRPASLFRIRSEISGHLVPSGKLSFA